MPEGKKLLQLVIVGLGVVTLLCSTIVSCELRDKDILQNAIFVVAAVGFWSWMGDVWS